MNSKDDKRTDKRISLLMSVVEKNAAKLNKEFLGKLQEKSTAEFLASSAAGNQKSQMKTSFSMWRIIMKSKLTKIAAAAVIIIACSISLIFWKSTGSGIALADVLTRIEQVTGYMYQIKSIATDPEQQGTETTTATIIVSNEADLKMTITEVDSNNFQKPSEWESFTLGEEWYLLPKSNSIVFINHKQKKYSRFFVENPKHHLYKKQYNEPREIIKQILNCEHKSLGQSIIDGVTVEGFQTTDKNYQGGFFGQADSFPNKKVDVKLWVDVNTFLPVRLEEDVTKSGDMHIQDISYDFRWNVIINPDDFEPNIPEDYNTPIGADVVFPNPNEENTIKGLKLFVDSVNKYPVDIKRSGVEYMINEDISDEEKIGKMRELLITRAPADFYETLINENKEPVYYGETVEPGNLSKVLLRWKLDDGRYRVIFGDLSAKTVTAEELAELEKQQLE